MGAEALREPRISMLRGAKRRAASHLRCVSRAARRARRGAPFESGLEASVTSARRARSDASAKAPRSCIHCRGSRRAAAWCWSAADVAGHHRHRAELAHRPRIAEEHAVEQRPLHIRQRHAAEGLSSRSRRATARPLRRAFPAACISGISSRATNGKVTKIVASTMPGTAKMIWMSCAASQGPSQPCAPNSSTKTGPQITGETENGRSISVTSSALAAELELGDRPGRADAEDDVERHRDRGDQQRQPDRRARVGIGDARRDRRRALRERLGEDDRERRDEEQSRERRASARSARSASTRGLARPRGSGLI